MAKGGARPGAGRPAGKQNQATVELKSAILGAFSAVGGVAYLTQVARDDPKTFCTLLGKVLPMQVTGQDGGALVVEIVRFGDQTS